MSKDYYKILGVEKNSSADELKTAFRKLAHQHHPDKKGGDEKKFKEANEAFQVLSDPKKRSQYDQFGSNFDGSQGGAPGGGYGGFGGFGGGFQGGQGGQGFDFGDLGDIFSNLGGFSQGGRGRSSKGQDIQIDVEMTLAEAVFGTERGVRLNKNSACDVCQGSGAEPGSKKHNCKICHGQGQVTQQQHTVFGTFQTAAVCSACSGEGQVFEQICRHCRGEGINKRQIEVKIKIPAGIDNGESIRLSGYGEAAKKGGIPGDLYVQAHVKKDPRFIRKGFDLYSKKNITFSHAALGTVSEIETFDGKLELKIPEGIQSGQLIRLKEKGVGRLQSTGRGDLYVEVIVETPKKLSRRQKELLEELKTSGI